LEWADHSSNKAPRRKQWGKSRHAGPDPASSLNFWIPTFIFGGLAGMTIHRKRWGIKKP
jgi:hypothetical protein